MDTKNLPELQGFLSVKQAMKELGFSKEGLRKLIISEELYPVYKIGELIVIPVKSIEKFKEKRRKQNNSDNRFKQF